MPTPGPVRRVITAQTKDGRSGFAFDEVVKPVVNERGQRYWPIWGADGVPQLPEDASATWGYTMFPPPAGFRVHVVEFAAAGAGGASPSGEWPRYGAPTVHLDGGMHYTDTVDVAIVLEGEIGLEQGDGAEVVLGPGTVLVQNGAVHRWKARELPCRICFVIQGAERQSD